MQLDFFDRVQIEQVIANCEHKNARGQVVCNVKHLHRVLVAEVNALQGMAAIGQRPLLMEEINTILQYVVERNKLLQCLHAKKHALESWRQLVEIFRSQLSDVTALAEFTEADEAMAELAVADNVFLFLTESVVGSENFYQEEFYIRKIHNLVTDFLALMPM